MRTWAREGATRPPSGSCRQWQTETRTRHRRFARHAVSWPQRQEAVRVRSLRRLPERQPDQRVEGCVRAQLVLRGLATAALASAGLKPRLASADRASLAAPPRGAGAPPPPSPRHSELALQFIGDARGELGPDAIGAADHRLVAIGDRARQFVGRQRRQDRQRDLAADALDRWSARGTTSRSARDCRSRTGSTGPRAPAVRSGPAPRRRSARAHRASGRCIWTR